MKQDQVVSEPTLVIIMMWSRTRKHSLLLLTIRQCTAPPPVTILFIIIAHHVSLIVVENCSTIAEIKEPMSNFQLVQHYQRNICSCEVWTIFGIMQIYVVNGKCHCLLSLSRHKRDSSLLSSVAASAWLDVNQLINWTKKSFGWNEATKQWRLNKNRAWTNPGWYL